MTRTELKNEAKEQIKGKIGILFLIFLIISHIRTIHHSLLTTHSIYVIMFL